MPIGVEETLKKADRTQLKRFYDQWYRPENMILVVVGDFRKAEVEPLVHRIFGRLAAAEAVAECPDFGDLQHKGIEGFYHFEEELGKSEVSIESLWDTEEKNEFPCPSGNGDAEACGIADPPAPAAAAAGAFGDAVLRGLLWFGRDV